MRLDLARVNQNKAGKALFATLTYPAAFPWDYREFKAHLAKFGKRFVYYFPNGAFHWKLEFQKRDAPHFHPIFWNVPVGTGKEMQRFRAWVAENWYEVVGSGDVRHLRAGTSVELMRSQMAIMRYCAGYLSDTDQTRPGQSVGRYWGVVGREKIPYGKPVEVELSDDEYQLILRTARRWMRSCNRVRRIKHAEKFAPHMTNDYLSGRYRRLRKGAPFMNCFKFTPRKMRLNNNRNLNLFCNADQWATYWERICELAARL